MSLATDIKTPFKSGNVLIQIIIVNVVIFIVLNLFRLFLFFSGYKGLMLEFKFGEVVSQVAMPMNVHGLLYKPWTLFTYFFSHVGVGHIFFNMLMLYFFGAVIQQFIGYSRTLAIYVFSGLIGGLLSLLLYSIVPVFIEQSYMPLIGASGSVMGIVAAAATLVPNQRVSVWGLFETKLVYIALFFIVIDFIGISSMDNIGHICHLGGTLTGFLFVRMMRSGTDLSKPFNKLFYGIKRFFTFKRQPRMKVVKNKSGKNTYTTSMGRDTGTTESKIQIQKRIDAILDKISKGGYESLSKDEKDYLFTHGKDI